VNIQINKNRTVALFGKISGESIGKTLDKIIELEQKEPGKEIFFLLNSGGGFNSPGFMFIDLINTLDINLTIIGSGMVGSMAVPIFAAGKKRIVTKHTMFFLHEVGRTFDGDSRLSTREIAAALESNRIGTMWYAEIIEQQTKNAFKADKVIQLMKDEQYLLPEKMKEYGLVHEII
jgi:ATP-dependent Clp protease, protease subunit